MSKVTYQKEYREIIEKLIKARLDMGLKQCDVARMLHKPQSFISKIERCERRIDVLELKQIANVYKKSVSEIIEQG